MLAQDIIIRPILSEKSYADIANKKYYFEVAKKATKLKLKQLLKKSSKLKLKALTHLTFTEKLRDKAEPKA